MVLQVRFGFVFWAIFWIKNWSILHFHVFLKEDVMFELTIRQKIAALILLFFLFLGGVLLFIGRNQHNFKEISDNPATDQIYVHICGAVQKPGVFPIKPATRKFEALKLAGGTLPEADLSRVNLAEYAEDGEQIYVPKIGEVLETPTKKKGRQTGKTSSAGSSSKQHPKGPFDINTATQQQLETVPGLGPSLAAEILRYRSARGNFANIEELDNVKGIGPAKLEKIRSFLFIK